MYFEIESEIIGSGSYGDIHLAKEKSGKEVAVKCCRISDNKGITNLIEPIIMSSFEHPYINHAHTIIAENKKLYIVQDLALNDLARATRIKKGGSLPNPNLLKEWTFALVQAVACLHRHSVIHCDIKAGNILLYPDDSIRLTDFGLAEFKATPEQTYNHLVGTNTHRPLENYLRYFWNESLDIWSLGCTLYEIAYGKLLFHHQDGWKKKFNNEKERYEIYQKYMNCLVHWGKHGPTSQHPIPDKLVLNAFQVEFSKYKYEGNIENEFDQLVLAMLVLDPKLRIKAIDAVKHNYFRNMTKSEYRIKEVERKELEPKFRLRVKRCIELSLSKESSRKIAFDIYARIDKELEIEDTNKIYACILLASKLTASEAKIKASISEVLEAEREICHHLSFHLLDF